MDVEVTIEEFQEVLKDRGYRITPQRVVVYETLVGNESHPSADDIYEQAKERFPMISRATVYKTLELLEELSLIQTLAFEDDVNRYDSNPSPHLNIVCIHCRQIYDVYDPNALKGLAEHATQQSGYHIVGQRHELYGVCPECWADEDQTEFDQVKLSQ